MNFGVVADPEVINEEIELDRAMAAENLATRTASKRVHLVDTTSDRTVTISCSAMGLLLCVICMVSAKSGMIS